MSLHVICPECETEHKIGDHLAGKKIRCKECREIIEVTDTGFRKKPSSDISKSGTSKVGKARSSRETEPPRSERRKKDRKRQEGLPVAWLVGGIAGGLAFLILVGGLAWWLLSSSRGNSPQPSTVAQGKPAEEDLTAKGGKTENPTPKPSTDSDAKKAKPPSGSSGNPEVTTLPPAVKGQLSAEALKELKGATVFIKVEAGRDLSCTGSGFLVQVAGNTGYIVTNHHVVNPEAEMLQPVRLGGRVTVKVVKMKAKNAVINAVFNSGTKTERSLTAEIIATDNSRDLAVLRVSGLGNWPRPITLEQKAQLLETMSVFILGFPFGEALSLTNGNPAVTVSKGSISSLRENEFGQMKSVQIDGAINPGNSGGPVVDEAGRLVGISVATIRGSGIGLAIAPDELTRLFNGRVGGVSVADRKFDNIGAEYDVEVQLIDPQNQMKSVALLYRGEMNPLQPLVQKPDGSFEPLPGTERLELQIDGSKATGRVKLTFNGPGPRFLCFQTTYVNGAGQPQYTQVISRPLRQGPPVSVPGPGSFPGRPPITIHRPRL